MRNIVIASHHRLAVGMAETLQFLTGFDQARVLDAFVDDSESDPTDRIRAIMDEIDPTDETFVFTDILGGSVTQRFYPHIGERVHLICGMNLPLVMEVALAGPEPFDAARIEELVSLARDAIVYVNEYEAPSLEEDE